MKCSDIISRIEEMSPPIYALNWDNVGLQVGRKEKEVGTVYIALDATDDVITEAIECEADMLITHHPMIFSPLKKVVADDFIGRRILRLAKYDISYYAMHTNFDVMGMADAAADIIDLNNREVLDVTYEDEIGEEGIGRVGRLPEIMTLWELCDFVKQRFEIDNVNVYGELDSTCEFAAISPGSGKSMIDKAVKAGADVLITGDIDYHNGIDAVAKGLNIIDAGHFGIEKIFVPYMEEFIRREIPGIKVYTGELVAPFKIV